MAETDLNLRVREPDEQRLAWAKDVMSKLGDREAYGELVTRFQSSVYAMALSRVRNPLEAQELAQEVFVHAMRKLPQLRDARCFAGWLRRITARMAMPAGSTGMLVSV